MDAASRQDADTATPEFTLRSVLVGLAIGCLLCFTNLYFGLQTGWISMMSLQSALIGYLIGKTFTHPSFTPQENVVIQTTAVATGTLPLAAGFVGIIPALSLLSQETDGVDALKLSWLQGVEWSLAVAFFGVFLAVPLRKQVIIKEKLAFPSGTATAQLISVLHQTPLPQPDGLTRRRGYEALQSDDVAHEETRVVVEEDVPQDVEGEVVKKEGWADLLYSFGASAALTVAAYFFPVLFAIPLFGTHLAREWLWSFSPSLSYVGQGVIMGFPIALSMNVGMLVGWGILSPLAKLSGWSPGPVGDMATGARGWILWVALAVMVSDSLVSLVPVAWELVRDYTGHGKREGHEDDEEEPPERLVPLKWVAWGIGASILLGTLLVWVVFGSDGIKSWATVIGFVLGCLLSVLGVRALGETDLNPVSGLGKVSQLLFAVIQPRNVVANIVAGGVAEAGAMQAGDLMQDLKTGHLLRASPRAQFYGQLVGSAVSIVVTTVAYSLYTRVYEIPGKEFPAPTSFVWLNLARLLRDGSLPPHTGQFMLAFGLVAATLAGAKAHARATGASWARWIPSGVAFAIGFLNTPSFSISRLIGGVVELLYRRHLAKTHTPPGREIRLIIIASGFVLGEGVASIVGLVFRTCGVGAASCWGCGTGICAGCG
ncbi:OPT superfamily oligopeptide transporter [Exidia glandulosa HHB12029]|uniref:OPT superfamily oligopeptide transporter n=1 Tax=Exidia glandulosa HHB12029 TaxID=1314781 RepID=A0A165Q125_EXIGL|nr:OPT superfamily oligopeptide transporter [Exidia glandulosa HHB12029]